jgi:hypothetical protein
MSCLREEPVQSCNGRLRLRITAATDEKTRRRIKGQRGWKIVCGSVNSSAASTTMIAARRMKKLTKSHRASLDLPGGVSNISSLALKSRNAIQTIPAWVLGRWVPVAHVVGTTRFQGWGGGNRDPALFWGVAFTVIQSFLVVSLDFARSRTIDRRCCYGRVADTRFTIVSAGSARPI